MAHATSASPDPVAPPRPSHHRLDIQGLRAVAVLAVVAFHAGLPIPGGFVGVDVFFVISGFVITGLLHRERSRTGRIRFGRFYVRRFKRLTPALAVMVMVTMLVSILVLSPFGSQQTAAKTGIAAMLLVANFVIARTTGGYFDAPAEANPLLNTWSLSVEEQFYLVFPTLLAVGWCLARRRRILRVAPVLIVGTLAVSSFGLAVASARGFAFPGSGTILGFYSPLTRAWEFAVGALLALAVTRWTPLAPRLTATLGAVGLGLLVASLWLITDATPFPGPWTLLPVGGTALLLLAGTHSNPASNLLSTSPLVKIGDWSYSIYLWHWPFVVFAAAIWPRLLIAIPIAAAVSFIPALMSYYWVEQPLRNISLPDRASLFGLVAVTIGVPLACASLLAIGARASWWISWPTTSTQDDHVALQDCTDKPFDADLCTWNGQLVGGRVLIAGDSQAYAVADGVIEAAKILGMSTVVSSRSGCPVSSMSTTGDKPLDCPTWQREVLNFAKETEPDVVVIANRSAGYTNPGWRTVIAPGGEPADSSNSEGVVALYETGLNDIVRELRQAGIGVVILQTIPEPDLQTTSPSFLRRLLPDSVPTQFDAGPALEDRVAVAAAEERIAAANPGTVVVDPVASLCPDGPCLLTTGQSPVYLDTWHLTREGALMLTEDIVSALKQANRP